MIGRDVISTLKQTKSRHQRLEDNIRKKYHYILKKKETSGPILPADFKEFNIMIGNPMNRNLDILQDMTPYQLEYHYAIQKYHKVIVNKARKIGATETVNRSIAYNVFGKYATHDIMIVAGNKLNIAREILIRFAELFENKKSGYAFQDLEGVKWKKEDLIRRTFTSSQHPTIEFKNDTRVFCFAASRQGKSQTFRGPDDLICIFLSEAAHTGMLEDQPIMNALEPNLANRDYGDFIMESTPNGKRGFYYNYWTDILEGKIKGWHPLTWDYTFGLKYNVLSKKFIKEQKTNPRIDFAQEYQCKFTSTISGAFKEEDLNYLKPGDPLPIDYLRQIHRGYDMP